MLSDWQITQLTALGRRWADPRTPVLAFGQDRRQVAALLGVDADAETPDPRLGEALRIAVDASLDILTDESR